MRIGEVWRYPAKSMGGERLERATVAAGGIIGDRTWAVRDEVRGGIRGAKKIGGLMNLAARYVTDPVEGEQTPAIEITLPNGKTVTSDDPDVNSRITAALDHKVTLWPLQPDPDHYRRGAPDSDDLLTELRDMFGREGDEPLPDFSQFPPEVIEYESPPGTYFDAYPLLVITDQSLASLERMTPGSRADVRRFRPNLVVAECETESRFPEQDWVGRTLVAGTAEFDVVARCPRCVMITRGFEDLPEDRELLRTVVREADQNIGVYAIVKTPGEVVVGGAVTLA